MLDVLINLTELINSRTKDISVIFYNKYQLLMVIQSWLKFSLQLVNNQMLYKQFIKQYQRLFNNSCNVIIV